MNTHGNRRIRSSGTVLGALLIVASFLSRPASAQSTVAPLTLEPSKEITAAVAVAREKAIAGRYSEAVAALAAAATTPHLPTACKLDVDFTRADIEREWGSNLTNKGQPQQAIEHLQASLTINQSSPNRRWRTAEALNAIGNAYVALNQYPRATSFFRQALLVCRQTNDRGFVAKLLRNLAIVDLDQGENKEAVAGYLNALRIYQEIKDRNSEGETLEYLALAYYNFHQPEAAIGFYEKSLRVYREIKNRHNEARMLYNTGFVYGTTSQQERAIDFYQQSLPIFREAKDQAGEAGALLELGNSFYLLGQYKNSVGFYRSARDILRLIKNKPGEVLALTGLGNAYNALSQYEVAITFFNQAMTTCHEVGDIRGEGSVLNNLGSSNYFLGRYEESIGFNERALAIFRKIKDRDNEAGALCSIGINFNALNQFDKAARYARLALRNFEEVKDKNGEADTLMNLGATYDNIDRREDAVGVYLQALAINRAVKDQDHEALTLINLGAVYDDLNHYEKARGIFEQALTLVLRSADRRAEAEVLNNFVSLWSRPENNRRNPTLAILFGKQSVNIYQSIRAGIKGMDKGAQKGYANSVADTYRDLADLLIGQDRYAEALQVLDLLKQEEYLNFSPQAPGGSHSSDLLAKSVDLDLRERRWQAALAARGDALQKDADSQSALARFKTHTAQQKRQLAAANQMLAGDEAAYKKTLANLVVDFPKKPDPVQDRLSDTSNAHDLQMALRTLGQGAVVLYTLATDKQVRLLLVTPSRIVAKATSLEGASDLDAKIAVFRALLQDPRRDPRPLGKHLYDLLIGPIKADLDTANAQTLLVSLDGNLRYIPLAALSPDGKHYLVETYRTALYTPAAIADLTREPKARWTALAMGVSDPPAGFAPLPAVPDELRSIVRNDGDSAGPHTGMFTGVRLLNETFTKSAMVSALGKDYPLVHIASHFVFTGDESTSFLLLGDGTHLTLSDLKALPEGIFAGVNLLTLSACETATGGIATTSGKGSGDSANASRDVENVAVLAQRKGADAVLASLWSVSDESTGLLMRTFYRDRQGGGGTSRGESKAEAIRQAQVALLTGTTKPMPSALIAKRGELLTVAPPVTHPTATPAFTPDPAKPWAHPYYWAPFILIGNSK